MNNLLYLNVPYSEKEEAKKLGAKWNPEKKKWYYNGNPENYIKFAKWLFKYGNFSLKILAEISLKSLTILCKVSRGSKSINA